jgi:hypothetical protein
VRQDWTVLFLVSGASGVGKSTVRELIQGRLGESFEAVELRHLGTADAVNKVWRQTMAERAAAKASILAVERRHLLLCGDPVPAGELIAAPSAVSVGGVAVCLLDASADAQAARLAARGDAPQHLDAHHGFAQWMRDHARDPLDRVQVITDASAPMMRWNRLQAAASEPSRWRVRIIDTTDLEPLAVADAVYVWLLHALADDTLVMHPEAWGAD